MKSYSKEVFQISDRSGGLTCGITVCILATTWIRLQCVAVMWSQKYFVTAVALEYQLSKLFRGCYGKNLVQFNTKFIKTYDSCFFCPCKLQMISLRTRLLELSWFYLAKIKNFKDEKETIAIAKTPGHRCIQIYIEWQPIACVGKICQKINTVAQGVLGRNRSLCLSRWDRCSDPQGSNLLFSWIYVFFVDLAKCALVVIVIGKVLFRF